MKKLFMIFATLGLVVQLSSCKAKKAQDDVDMIDNADVEKIEAEDSALATNTTADTGPVDESLQAALGESSSPTSVEADPSLAGSDTATMQSSSDTASAPAFDENSLGGDAATPNELAATPTTQSDATLTTDPGLSLDNPSDNTAMATTETPGITETPIIEEPVSQAPAYTDSSSSTVTEPPVKKSKKKSTFATETASSDLSPKPASSAKSLKKIAETTPYQMGDAWINTVYIARPGEKLKEISNKIYGADKTKDLKKYNAFLKARSAKGGDKIYYSSPNRPTDSTRMISYYEDTGMMADTYIAQPGDDLRKVAKNLLGYEDGWKEMWTTNNVVSKRKLEPGESLKYWKSASAVATMAGNPSGTAQMIDSAQQLPGGNLPPPPPMPEPQPQMANNTQPPPDANIPPPPPMPETQMPDTPPQAVAQADIPPPPPTEAMATTEPPPPPPPPDIDAAAPEAPKKKVNPNMEEQAAEVGGDSDTMMMMGGVVILCALLAFALIRRNKKKKEAEMAMSETNIGIGT